MARCVKVVLAWASILVIAGCALDKASIRRVVHHHQNDVRFCYEKELVRTPDLNGRVMIWFIIGGSGQVVESVVQSSTTNNPTVDQCIADAVRRWAFPKPKGGGFATVAYPFELKAATE